jgi:ribosomal protein L37AE/L43A
VPKVFRTGAVLARAAFMAGWAYRAFIPKVSCPKCGGPKWARMGGGLKQCRACGHKFFMQLPDATTPGH